MSESDRLGSTLEGGSSLHSFITKLPANRASWQSLRIEDLHEKRAANSNDDGGENAGVARDQWKQVPCA